MAAVTFRKWARASSVPTSGGDVLLWVDTFNNSFHPETLRAAVVASIPGSRLALLDSNHEIPIERPRDLAGLLEAFQAGLGAD